MSALRDVLRVVVTLRCARSALARKPELLALRPMPTWPAGCRSGSCGHLASDGHQMRVQPTAWNGSICHRGPT